ncbi:MAG TPA: cytochrome c oxidase subunit II [Pseudonocardiaceae bacterium]|nr:cytochrome c oxidase subunit II [Pseudonocardiaceae bacterium]
MNFHQVFGRVLTVDAAIAGGVFVLVLAALVVAVVRRRAGSGRQPAQRSERNKLELVYLGLLVAAAAFLIGFTFWANGRDTQSARPQQVSVTAATGPRVSVTAFQWCWRFHYLDRPVTVAGKCRPHDYPTMVVPIGKPINIELTSQDVVHAFWIPALDVKVDAYPDHTNTFTLTFDKPGKWLGRCAEFCGTYHTTMDFWVRAVTPAQYQRWLTQQGA